MDPRTEHLVAVLAGRQHGLVTREQLVDLGVARSTVVRRAGRGLLVPVGRRVFRLAGHPASEDSEVMAACLDLGGVATHATSTGLHDLLPTPWPWIDVSVRKQRSVGSQRIPGRWRVHTSTNLPDEDLVVVRGIPAASVARSLLGLAALPTAEVDDDLFARVLEDAVRRRMASDRWLWWLLEQRRCRGRDGVARFEAALAVRADLGPTESWLERELLDVLRRAGLPRPVVQRTVRRRGAFVARVDAAYPEEHIVLEALGYAAHASREALSADAARASRLTLLGHDVHQFTYDQIVSDPGWVVRVVRAALARAHGSSDVLPPAVGL